MSHQVVKINTIKHITHDVLQIVTDKPGHLNFLPGQATEVSINQDGWKGKKRPFTFTSLPVSDYLEFTIKTYPSRKSVTNKLIELSKHDELILHEVFGAIEYNKEGVFIAGGAGITPFISIFRYLQSKNKLGNNKLIFANNTKADIILEQEFKELLGDNFINILSNESVKGYDHGQITEDFLSKHIIDRSKHIYLCGPPPMMEAVEKQLDKLKVDKTLIVKEAF